ncbi:hypothetical protein MKS88_005250 [Plasmodium brasilianum]|uniref:Uncharacterized protein n=1 Tax=Plasmodium brasilianum TaxID=5824 RepID=A0ACB9Y196_PLABR|nr:hypothetical protein MKS88_005250 [Plasmodium brasilianum]
MGKLKKITATSVIALKSGDKNVKINIECPLCIVSMRYSLYEQNNFQKRLRNSHKRIMVEANMDPWKQDFFIKPIIYNEKEVEKCSTDEYKAISFEKIKIICI